MYTAIQKLSKKIRDAFDAQQAYPKFAHLICTQNKSDDFEGLTNIGHLKWHHSIKHEFLLA